MNTINQKQVAAYVAARYPGAKRNHSANGWDTPRYPSFVSDDDALSEALAENDAYEEGLAKKPEWLGEGQ